MGYGPRLTAKQRASLLAEIQAFDEKATLAKIEREAVGRKDVDAYEKWRSENPGPEPLEANPDQLSDDCAQPWGRAVSADLTGLSLREKEAWRLCKQDGLRGEEAALRMNISKRTLDNMLYRASRKLRGNV